MSHLAPVLINGMCLRRPGIAPVRSIHAIICDQDAAIPRTLFHGNPGAVPHVFVLSIRHPAIVTLHACAASSLRLLDLANSHLCRSIKRQSGHLSYPCLTYMRAHNSLVSPSLRFIPAVLFSVLLSLWLFYLLCGFCFQTNCEF